MSMNGAVLSDSPRGSIVDENKEDENLVNGVIKKKKNKMIMQEEEEDIPDDLLYRVNESPPWYMSMAFAVQQFLLGIGSFLTLPLLMLQVLCADESPSVAEYRTSLIGTTCFVAGISTIMQTTFGLRLPVLQGTTGAYLVSAIAVLDSTELKCPKAIDLMANETSSDLTIAYGENSTVTLQDNFANTTILTEPDSNYYRDNDGMIRNSNEVWMKRMNEIQGAVICCSLLQFVIGCSGIMGFLVKFIGPLTIAPTLAMITYGMLGLIVDLSSIHWGIATLVTAVFFVTSMCMINVNVPLPSCRFSRRKIECISTRMPIFAMFPIIFAIGIGWLVCYIVTVAGGFSDNPKEPSYNARTDSAPSVIADSPWFRLPYPFQYGYPIFNAGSIIGMLAAVIPGILESIGDYAATAYVCREPSPPRHAINRGIAMEGFGIFTAGIFGTGNAATSWSDNIVVIGISRVASRQVFQIIGGMLMVLGVFSKFLSVFATLPKVILGGVLCSTFGMLLAVGIGTLRHVDMTKNRNLFVFGFSILIGMVSSMYAGINPERIDIGVTELNNIFRVLLRNPMFISGFSGFVLDNIAPGSRKIRGLETFLNRPGEKGSNFSTYDLPFKTNWKWTKRVPICPRFSSKNAKCCSVRAVH